MLMLTLKNCKFLKKIKPDPGSINEKKTILMAKRI